MFAQTPEGSMRQDLMKMAADRLDAPVSVLEKMLSGAGSRRPRASAAGPAHDRDGRQGSEGERRALRRAPRTLSRRDETERAFLALCIASPEEGASVLRALDVERDFSSELLVRAARRLRDGDLTAPMAEAPGEPELGEDGDLLALLAELIVQAAGEEPNPSMLEVQRLQLELASLERGIQQARGREGSDVSGLARQKAELKVEFDRAYSRVLDESGERDR